MQITESNSGQITVECEIPFSYYQKATAGERKMLIEKASLLEEPANSPESIQEAKAIFNAMDSAARQKVFARIGTQTVLEKIGYEVELDNSRKTTLLQCGRPVRS